MQKNEIKLKEVLEKIGKLCESGDRKALAPFLRHILEYRRFYYQESIRKNVQNELSDAFLKALLLELDQEEEESIETAELSYAAIGSALLENPEKTAELYRRRLLLLHYFGDYFADVMILLFLEKYRENHLMEARNLALDCLEKMRIHDMLWLEENVPGSIDADEQLSDACNAFEADTNLAAEELEEAETLHNVLYAFLKSKYKAQ